MLNLFLNLLASIWKTRRALVLENLALRHQLTVLSRSPQKPRLNGFDRGLWALLCRYWKEWRTALVIVRPETVIRWHR